MPCRTRILRVINAPPKSLLLFKDFEYSQLVDSSVVIYDTEREECLKAVIADPKSVISEARIHDGALFAVPQDGKSNRKLWYVS
jgi:hypothetical protein